MINELCLSHIVYRCPTVIYAAKKCKSVICFEPDPIAYNRLLSNISLNDLDNVSAYNIAISDNSGLKKMSSFGGKLGDSMTSLLSTKTTSSSFNALVLDWDFIEKLYDFKKVDFIKIDIEGGEFSLIPKLEDFLKKKKPILWLSMHTPFLTSDKKEEVQKIIDVLSKCYNTCLDSNLKEININEMKSEESLSSFPAFLFKN